MRGGGFLEIGFGDGTLMRRLSTLYKNAKFVGFEAREYCVNDMKALGYDCRLSTNEIFDMEQKFDVIYGSGVLHHMHDPYATFLSLFKLLKKNGIIIFVKEHHAFDIPTHVYTTIARQWKYETNAFKMFRKRFIELVDAHSKNYYVRYEDMPFLTCFKNINSVYSMLKMNRIPFLNNITIFAKNG